MTTSAKRKLVLFQVCRESLEAFHQQQGGTMITVKRIENTSPPAAVCHECADPVTATVIISFGGKDYCLCPGHALGFLAPFVAGPGIGTGDSNQRAFPEEYWLGEFPAETTVTLPDNCRECALYGEGKSEALETICRRCQKRKLGELTRKLGSHSGTVVLMNCEFGYKSKFWLVPMTGDAFEHWWAAQESFGAPSLLSRLIMEYPLSSVELPGECIWAETKAEDNRWNEMNQTGKYYYCHFFDDEFTYLTTPDGKTIHHKGYCGRDVQRSSGNPEDSGGNPQ